MQARRLKPWLPAIAWAALIFGLSSIPSLGTGLGFWDLLLRKLAHAAEFGLLALLIWYPLRRQLPAAASGAAALGAAALAAGYAATDEYHQTFVSGRVGSVSDWAIDTAGVVITLAAVHLWRQRRGRAQNKSDRADAGPRRPPTAQDEVTGNAP